MRIDPNGRVGIGRIPGAIVDGPYALEASDGMAIVGDASLSTFAIYRAVDFGNTNPGMSCYSADGTEALPTNTKNGMAIAGWFAKGFDGTNFSLTGSRANIQMFAVEDFSPTAQGTRMRFRVTAPGSIANTNNALTIAAAADNVPRVGIGMANAHSALQVGGSMAAKLSSIVFAASPYAAAEESVIIADATGGAIVVNLPTAVGISGRMYSVKKVDSSANAVDITPDGTEMIDGVNAAVSITLQYSAFQVISDGANWWVI
jgi:hypothetical protein